jgi:hypothetical protein
MSMTLDQLLGKAAAKIRGNLCRKPAGRTGGGQFTSCGIGGAPPATGSKRELLNNVPISHYSWAGPGEKSQPFPDKEGFSYVEQAYSQIVADMPEKMASAISSQLVSIVVHETSEDMSKAVGLKGARAAYDSYMGRVHITTQGPSKFFDRRDQIESTLAHELSHAADVIKAGMRSGVQMRSDSSDWKAA